MKKIVLTAVFGLMCTLMCGCLQETPLTDEELDIVAEYAAELLLKYDKNYRNSLITQEEMDALLTETPTPTVTMTPQGTPTPTPTPQQGPTGGPQTTPEPTREPSATPAVTPVPDNTEDTNKQLTEVVGTEGFYITYEYYELKEEVISNEYLSLAAKEGRQYMVVHFRVHNRTGEEKVFDATEQKMECSIDINLGNVSRASLSMLENDLRYMPITVPANSSADAVLVFEISAKLEINTAHMVLMNKDDEAVIIKLK